MKQTIMFKVYILLVWGFCFVSCARQSPSSSDSNSSDKQTIQGQSLSKTFSCPLCQGAGRIADYTGSMTICFICRGQGTISEEAMRNLQSELNQPSPYTNPSSGRGYSSDYLECPNCYGNGKCSMCAGRGEYHVDGMYGQPGGYVDCSICHGGGRCPSCHGSGRIRG